MASVTGLKEAALQQLGCCAVCGKPQLGQSPTFYVVTISHAGFDVAALQRRVGLQQLLGGNGALAAVMGLDEDLAKIINGPHQVFVHEGCAGNVGHLLALVPDQPALPDGEVAT